MIEERDLAGEITGSKRRDGCPSDENARGSLDDHEELPTRPALTDEYVASGSMMFVHIARDERELAP